MLRSFIYITLVTIINLCALSALFSQDLQKSESFESDSLKINDSISTLNPAEFNKGFILDIPDIMIGNVAGLSISQPGSNPEAFTDIRVRGLSSIRSSTSPLFVVDDVPVRSIEHLEPADIQSIEVWKDASVAVKFGIRGAAGVIKIETKTGSTNNGQSPSVTYHSSVASSFIANRIEFLNTKQYRRLAASRTSQSIYDYGSSTNWQEKVTQRGFSSLHNLSISGSSQQSSYRVSGNFRSIGTIHPGADEKKIGARVYLSHRTLNNQLRLTGRITVSDKTSSIGLAEVFRYANTYNPTAPVFDENDNYFEQNLFDTFNPLAILNQSVHDRESNYSLIQINARLDAKKFVDGLFFNSSYSREKSGLFNGEYYGKSLRFRGERRNGLAQIENKEWTDQFFETSIEYNLETASLSNKFEVGYNYHSMVGKGQFQSGGDFLSDNVLYHNIESARDFSNGRGTIESYSGNHTIISFYTNLSTSFRNHIHASVVARYEGSTRLGEDNKWGKFYGLNLGTELTNWFDFGLFDKFYSRIGYGITGQVPPMDGLSLLIFEPGPEILINGSFVPSSVVQYTPNPALKWEEKNELNIGLDLAMLDERLAISADYFSNKIDDLIYPVPVPVPPNLAPTQWANIGSLENSGIEISTRYTFTPIDRLEWNSSIHFSTVQSKLVSLSNDQFRADDLLIAYPGAPGYGSISLTRLREGDKIGNFWGPKFAGLDESGNWLFKNASGDIVSSENFRLDDNQVIGNGLPNFTLGWNHQLEFHNWDFSMLWQGEFGHDMINLYRLFYENPVSLTNYNVTKSSLNSKLNASPQYSSYYVEKASYFRLQHLSIGYTFEFGMNNPIQQLRVYAAGNNLWTITNYKGVDPSSRLSTLPPTDNGAIQRGMRNPLAPGIERRNIWPTQTTLLAGVQLIIN